jgi:CheY-like chemotaxis protein
MKIVSKKIFLLDDSIKRLQRLQRLFAPHTIYHTASALEAIDRLKIEKFDLILLDHDLTEDDQHWIAEGSGLDVAQFLGQQHTPNDNTLIVVHTMNPAGGHQMMAALANRRTQRLSIVDFLNPAVIAILVAD